MILPDANILLYAYNADAEKHDAARIWLEDVLADSTIVCFGWQTITAFVRISTNARLFPKPLSLKTAFEIVEEWLALPNVAVLQPTEKHLEIFKRIAVDGQASGALLMDAHLAALAIEHGAIVYTTDRDFSRFDGLKTENPLAGI